MTTQETATDNPQPENQLEGGTYEIIKGRLEKHGNDLRERLDQLNHARKEVFGSIETKLIATERITTDHNCTPRDLVPFGKDKFLFGYNVHIGLKTTVEVEDVFSVYQYADHVFHQQPSDIFKDKAFQEDFSNLYKYYRHTTFVKFAEIGVHLFMVFKIGKGTNDIKTFKWLRNDDTLQYLNNRSDHEFNFPDQHEFTWTRTNRDMIRQGKHSHISIADRLFVETINGDLTIKVEDNTDVGHGIYSEPVEQKDQTLDDAEISYAMVGNLIFLKIRPYQEDKYRFIIYNEKNQEAIRVDALENSCVLLPDDQGVVFAKGFYIQTGEFKLFDNGVEDMLYERKIAAPNGEDFLYIFYHRESGLYNLLSYNLISQTIEAPILCHGFANFQNGELCYFKAEDEPKKHHAIQIWQTPYVDHNVEVAIESDSYLFKVGNKDIVRAMAEAGDLIKLINKGDTYADLYVDLVRLSNDMLDSYYWLNNEDAFALATAIQGIRDSAAGAVDEFEKVVRIKKNTLDEVTRVQATADELVASIKRARPDNIDVFVNLLAELRAARGAVISLKELRYVDLELVKSYEKQLEEYTENLSQDCVKFLLKADALAPYEAKIKGLQEKVDKLEKVVEANRTEKEITKVSEELEMLIEIVSNLKIEDATHTTKIIDNISAMYAGFNQINASLKRRRKELLGVEGKAEFNAQLKLINQGVINYLDVCDTPEKCDEYLTKLMVQIEELEGKFSEFDDFVAKITEKREEIYNAFESRKLSLVEARNKRANTLLQSAERILKGISNRLAGFKTQTEINGYFASDLMVDKVRDIIKQLIELEDTVKADDIQSRLKTVREETLRQLKDKNELFVDGENIISFGKHKFMVNTRKLDLTVVMRNGLMCYHLTGTNFFEPIEDEAFLATKAVWDQSLVSENQAVYRAEYLAYLTLQAAIGGRSEVIPPIEELEKKTDQELIPLLQQFMAPRYNEGYTKGVHDQDAVKILHNLIHLYSVAGLLRYNSRARVCAALYWQFGVDQEYKDVLHSRLKGAGNILDLFPGTREFDDIIAELQQGIAAFNESEVLFTVNEIAEAGAYLFYEITHDSKFVIAYEAAELLDRFKKFIKDKGANKKLDESLKLLEERPIAQFKLARKWVLAYAGQAENAVDPDYVDEVAGLLQLGMFDRSLIITTSLKVEVDGMHGNHTRIDGQNYHLNFNHFMARLRHFETVTVQQFEAYSKLKNELVEKFRKELRLEAFKPRVLSSFVRNRLIDELYLPLIGDNLAKQIGTAGESKRTDLMGMLLLVSPPGYGKTTLMEYIASRLGIVFMKINGPAIGHQVVSLDPSEATNASAKEELEKLNLALEMGDNVMLYLDDIQHCNPEFLQKFISLCDAQRKIEGVYKGESKTYDLRGRKVCVVMAGNPYTESGDKFQVPDMLANRADIYNLGDIIGDSATAFKMSYIENSLTANPVLARLATKSTKDVQTFLHLAETGDREGIEFEANHSVEEVNEYVGLFQKLIVIRDILLKVNMEYIYSAAQAEEYRVEPPFKLQGSYRNMNKISEKVMPIMNDQELQTLILSHYENESQTLTTGAEANLLKFKELFEVLETEDEARWSSIKETYQRNAKRKGLGGNQIGEVLSQMEAISTGLKDITAALRKED